MLRKEIPSAGDIFKREEVDASVMQDKKPPGRLTAGSSQPVTATETRETASSQSRTQQDGTVPPTDVAVNRQTGSDTGGTPADNFQKHHGSETRQLSLVAGRLAPHLKTQVLKRAKDKGWSESKTVADLVEQALANDLAKSFAVSLKNSLTAALTGEVRKEHNRAANIALEAFYSSEESRILTIYTLRFILGDAELLAEVIEEAVRRFHFTNPLLPRAFPSLTRIQSDLLAITSELLHAPGSAGGRRKTARPLSPRRTPPSAAPKRTRGSGRE